MNILTYINRMNQIYGDGQQEAAPVRYNTQQYLQGGRVKYQGAGLVDHGPAGVRQGYGGEGSGIPGIKQTKAEKVAYHKKYYEEHAEKIKKEMKEYHKKTYVKKKPTPLQSAAKEQLEWISKNAKNYVNPNLMQTKFMTHFKIQGGLENAAIFKNAIIKQTGASSINLKNAPNIKGITTQGAPGQIFEVFNFSKGKTESRLFSTAIIQNNKAAVKRLNDALKLVHEDYGILSSKIHAEKLTFEEALQTLGKRKYQALDDFGLGIREPGGYGGIRRGSFKTSLIEAGINKDYFESYQLVRQPLINVEAIVKSLDMPGGRTEWGLTKAEALKTQEGWEKIKKGKLDAGKWIDNLEGKIGKGKFRSIFGNVIFEHQLAKTFGRPTYDAVQKKWIKNWDFLPRDYLLRGQVGNQSFNQMKKNVFDRPIATKIKKYQDAVKANNTTKMAQLEGEIKDLYTAFNNTTEGYMKGYQPTFKGGKFEWKAAEPAPFSKQMIHKYDNPRLAIKETQEMSLGMRNLSKAAEQVGKTGEQIFSKKQLGHIKDFRKKQDKFANLLAKNLDNLDSPTLTLLGKRHGCLNMNEGGSLLRCLKGKLNQNSEKFLQTTGRLAAATKSPGLLKWIQAGRKIARGTGLFAVWEGIFAPVIAGMMIPSGESGKRITHEIFYGPLLEAMGVPPKYVPGESEKEELMRHFKDDPKAYAVHKLMEIGGEGEGEERMRGELDYLYEDWSAVAGEGTPTSKAKGELWKSPQLLQIEKLIKDKEQEYQKYINTPGFYQGPAGQYKDQEAINKAFATRDEGLLTLAADREANKEWYRKYKLLAGERESWDIRRFRKAGGGLTRTVAPDSGPMSGLPSLYNRARRK